MRFTIVLFVLFFSHHISTAQNLPLKQIELKSLSGERMTMDQVIPKGQHIILSFWATWCAPCKKELDAITKIYDEWQEKYNVTLLAISTDDPRTAGRIKSTVSQQKWPFEVYHDTDSKSKQIFNFSSIPFTAVLDSEGNLVYTHVGYQSGDENKLAEKLAELQ